MICEEIQVELETLKQNDLDPEDYEEMKKDTLDQLQEFKKFNENPLLNEASNESMELKTPSIIQMFKNKSTEGLRQTLAELERDLKVGKISVKSYEQSKIEILKALLKLNEITEDEKKCLAQAIPDLTTVDDTDSSIGNVEKVLSTIKNN